MEEEKNTYERQGWEIDVQVLSISWGLTSSSAAIFKEKSG